MCTVTVSKGWLAEFLFAVRESKESAVPGWQVPTHKGHESDVRVEVNLRDIETALKALPDPLAEYHASMANVTMRLISNAPIAVDETFHAERVNAVIKVCAWRQLRSRNARVAHDPLTIALFTFTCCRQMRRMKDEGRLRESDDAGGEAAATTAGLNFLVGGIEERVRAAVVIQRAFRAFKALRETMGRPLAKDDRKPVARYVDGLLPGRVSGAGGRRVSSISLLFRFQILQSVEMPSGVKDPCPKILLIKSGTWMFSMSQGESASRRRRRGRGWRPRTLAGGSQQQQRRRAAAGGRLCPHRSA